VLWKNTDLVCERGLYSLWMFPASVQEGLGNPTRHPLPPTVLLQLPPPLPRHNARVSESPRACAEIRWAVASDSALMRRAFALPRAAISACMAPAAATAPALRVSAICLSIGTAEITLMDTMETPYWVTISLACWAATVICCTLKICERHWHAGLPLSSAAAEMPHPSSTPVPKALGC